MATEFEVLMGSPHWAQQHFDKEDRIYKNWKQSKGSHIRLTQNSGLSV